MAQAQQGFALRENLSEATNDRAILNNLAGPPLADDINLLFNNTRNTSSLVVDESNIQGNEVVFENAFAVFSNKTKLTVNDSVFYVKNSNGIDRFSLSTQPDLSDDVTTLPIGTYVRSDEVTSENIQNFSRLRRNPDRDRVDEVTQLGALRNDSTSALLGSSDVKSQLESSEFRVDVYSFRRDSSIKINENFLGSRLIEVNGSIIIKDPDNLNNVGLSDENPGLFIFNPDTGSGVRAFSSAENPWEEEGNDLVVSTELINIRNLNFRFNTITLNSKGSAVLSETVPAALVDANNFTHTVPILVNGELYNLCLKLEN